MTRYLTINDAALELGVSRVRVRQLIEAKKLVAHKFAGRWFVSAKSVDRRLKERSD